MVVDANVFVSFLVDRDEKQRELAKALIQSAEDGALIAVFPEFVILEIVFVLQNTYRRNASEVATIVKDLIEHPGIVVSDACPWKQTFEFWPSAFASISDAAIVAVAVKNRYDSIATFDQKMIKQMKTLGVASYW